MFNLFDTLQYTDPSIDYMTLSMPYAVLPNSCYNINENNNILVLFFAGVYEGYVFPTGNYNVQTFMTKFMQIFPSEFSITFNSTTNKFSITNSGGPFQFTEGSTMDFVIGFSGSISSTTASAPYTMQMPRSVCFLPSPVFNICSNQISNGTALGKYSPAYGQVMASIPNLAKLGNSNVLQNPTAEFVFTPTSNGQLILTILDAQGFEVDFNGLASYFALQFKVYRKPVERVVGDFKDIVGQAILGRSLIELDTELGKFLTEEQSIKKK